MKKKALATRMASPSTILRKLAKIPKDWINEYAPKPQMFTDIEKLFQGGYHSLIVGITGGGKTTLLLKILKELRSRGFTILARDDGGLEASYLLPYTKITYWIPEGCELRMNNCPYNYDIAEFNPDNPMEILDHVFESPFNLVVFDAYTYEPALSAEFWAELFKSLIFKCMQTPRSKKRKLIFSIDELNDLIQPKGYNLTPKHAKVRALIEYNIRKLRKHNVTLIATSHRFTQLGISVRSQFSYVIVKQSYGWDAWDFLSKSLATQNNKVFWAILKDVTSFAPQYFYLFDYKNRFDKYQFSDIPRPDIDPEPIGVLKWDGKDGKQNKKKERELWKRRMLMMYWYAKGLSPGELAQKLNMTVSAVQQELYRYRAELNLLND